MKKQPYLSFLGTFLLVGYALGGLPVQASPSEGIDTKLQSGDKLFITSAITSARPEGGTKVEGYVTRDRRYSVPAQAHLHVVAFDRRGHRVADQCVRFNPVTLGNSPKGSLKSAPYEADLPVSFAEVSSVIVIYHHDHSHPHCASR